MHQFVYILLGLMIMTGCGQQNKADSSISKEVNPAAKGFNLSESDKQAINIADEVMIAMGGRQAWDKLDVVQWTFFGRRTHTWDKENQRVHIAVPGQKMEYDLNIDKMTGSVSRDGIAYEERDSIDHYLNQAKSMWINDSYWLFMPFKLKDSGVRLRSVDTDTTRIGEMSDLLELTFTDVGVTPDNKYVVYVNQDSRLVTQWDFYTTATDSLPRFQSPWPDYESYGNLILSGGAINGNNAISDISLGAELRSIFQ